ncbi:NDR1/HIN1-like protein 6 [Rhodamnia argentea]|uniref:NDR1/HIN1-like protein 6 n=1 Tax=Rhodamnia argentea TaxID=178133 RepID=A0A8B8NTU8_9MYRT|nr:NDR1/HIN1-like protein 6 [Rhodamnia argentea]
MAEKVYPSKPSPVGAAAPNPPFPSTKAQLYGANRPAYRPQPPRRHRRSCCCSFCMFLTLLVLALLFLAAILATVLFLVYRPHRPTFAVSALKLSYLNVSQSSSTVSSKFDLNVTAKNPNKKLVYYYGPMTISVSSDGVHLGEGSFPSFVHGTKNTTLLETSIASDGGGAIDTAPLAKLTSDMKGKSGLPLEVKLETKVKAKMGSLKTPKVQIRVTCVGIKVRVPSGNATATASTAGAECKVRTRVKIWKWTF